MGRSSSRGAYARAVAIVLCWLTPIREDEEEEPGIVKAPAGSATITANRNRKDPINKRQEEVITVKEVLLVND